MLATSHYTSLARLEDFACRHPAVRHPWLKRFAAGEFEDVRASAMRFAYHYQAYSAWFPRFLMAVIMKLDDPAHVALLEENLAEERGELGSDDESCLRRLGIDPELVASVPHPELFRRCCRSLGVDSSAAAAGASLGSVWRSRLLSFLRRASAAAAVGALGLGTEHVVRPIYTQILRGLGWSEVPREDAIFFELHCHVDDQHHKDLLEISRSYMLRPGGASELEYGIHQALEMRCQFFDGLLALEGKSSEVRS